MLLRDTRRCIVSLAVLVTVFILIVTWNYTRKGYAELNVPFIHDRRQCNETTAAKVGRGDNTGQPNAELQTENTLTEKLVDQPKLILLWNRFFAKKDFNAGGYGKEPFLKCPQQNCFLTRDRGSLSQASVVLFHVFGGVQFPAERDPDQLYVFVVRMRCHLLQKFRGPVPNFHTPVPNFRGPPQNIQPPAEIFEAGG